MSVTRPRPDRQVVDLGQNINGWLRLSNLGPEGTELTIVHGEALDRSGDVTQDNLLSFFLDQLMYVGMTDHVVAAGTPGRCSSLATRRPVARERAPPDGHPGRGRA